MIGYVHSLQSLGTVDGPGVRAVVFAAGCPYRCVYCHNPDTWRMSDGKPTELGELTSRISRLIPYIKDGGVTLSGGEPCLQAEFFLALVRELHGMGLHVALDTAAAVTDERALQLAVECDLLLLDVKMTSEEDYERYVGGTLKNALAMLDLREKVKKPTWVRQVIVPGINDSEQSVIRLCELLRGYSTVERIELLPFRKLCLEKYEALGIPFPLSDTPEADPTLTEELERLANRIMKERG